MIKEMYDRKKLLARMRGVRGIWSDAIAARTSHRLHRHQWKYLRGRSIISWEHPFPRRPYRVTKPAGWLTGYPAGGGGSSHQQQHLASISNHQQQPPSQHLPPSPRQVVSHYHIFLTRAFYLPRARSRGDVYYVR